MKGERARALAKDKHRSVTRTFDDGDGGRWRTSDSLLRVAPRKRVSRIAMFGQNVKQAHRHHAVCAAVDGSDWRLPLALSGGTIEIVNSVAFRRHFGFPVGWQLCAAAVLRVGAHFYPSCGCVFLGGFPFVFAKKTMLFWIFGASAKRDEGRKATGFSRVREAADKFSFLCVARLLFKKENFIIFIKNKKFTKEKCDLLSRTKIGLHHILDAKNAIYKGAQT